MYITKYDILEIFYDGKLVGVVTNCENGGDVIKEIAQIVPQLQQKNPEKTIVIPRRVTKILKQAFENKGIPIESQQTFTTKDWSLKFRDLPEDIQQKVSELNKQAQNNFKEKRINFEKFVLPVGVKIRLYYDSNLVTVL